MSVMPNSQLTQQESTKNQYRLNHDRIARLAGALDITATNAEVSPQRVAAFYLNQEASWSQATARLYRASLAFVFKEKSDEASREAHDILFGVGEEPELLWQRREELRAKRKQRCRIDPRTSAQKSKSLKPEDRRLLFVALDVWRSRYASVLKTWLLAGPLTGLRPAEWEHALLTSDRDSQLVLLVRNAKNSNGRAHGTHRTIELGAFSEDQILILRVHLQNVRIYINESSFTQMYEHCRKLLQRVTTALWPRRLKRPTLYTARHIFAADAKVSHDRIAVAAMMGHASTETAYSHYGKRHTGSSGMAARPNASDMEAVLKRNTKANDMRTRRTMGS